MAVRFGEYDLEQIDGDEEQIAVDRYIIHPRYNETIVMNDIALLRLRKAVQYPYACLPKTNKPLMPEQECSIMGWGKMHTTHQRGSRYLLETKVNILHFILNMR